MKEEYNCDCCGWDDCGHQHEPNCSALKTTQPKQTEECEHKNIEQGNCAVGGDGKLRCNWKCLDCGTRGFGSSEQESKITHENCPRNKFALLCDHREALEQYKAELVGEIEGIKLIKSNSQNAWFEKGNGALRMAGGNCDMDAEKYNGMLESVINLIKGKKL